MVVHLLRHTQPNIAKGICYGQSDLDVDDSFDDEVKEILKTIGNQKFDVIYSSPLKRCMKLAQKVAHNIEEIICDDRLKELNFGEWELKTWNEIAACKTGQEWFDDYLNKSCLGGESYPELVHRVECFIDDIKNTHFNKNVLVVAHAGVIRVFHKLYAGMSMEDAFKMNLKFGELFTIEL